MNASLNASTRTYLYGVANALLPLLVGLGLVSTAQAPLIVTIVGAVLSGTPSFLAFRNATQPARAWLYGVATAVIPLLVLLGSLSSSQAPLIVGLLGALLTATPSTVAIQHVTPDELPVKDDPIVIEDEGL